MSQAQIGNVLSALESVSFADGTTEIGEYAFLAYAMGEHGMESYYYRLGLNKVTLPDSLTTIERSAFGNCAALESIIIPNNVTQIGDDAFNNCKKLISIVIPTNTKNIGACAFEYCTRLTNITYSGTKEQWSIINFGFDWDYETNSYTITCTDGTITK